LLSFAHGFASLARLAATLEGPFAPWPFCMATPALGVSCAMLHRLYAGDM